MPIQPEQAYASEIETIGFNVNLMGAGAASPTRKNNRNNYTPSRSGVGTIKISFLDDPGPTYQSICGFGFGDPTPANVAGWTVVDMGYTPRSGTVAAFVQFQIYNGANAAADLPGTSTLTVEFGFKQAAVAE
jgi:hypothetical protein